MLTGKQRNFLRALGNKIKPVVFIGKAGISKEVIDQFNDALEARELVKGRVLTKTPHQTRKICEHIAQQVEADVVQVIGYNFLLYRPSVKKRRIILS